MPTKAELEEQVHKLERKVARLEKAQDSGSSEEAERQAQQLEDVNAENEDLLGRIAALGDGEEVILPSPHTGPVLIKDLDDDRLLVRAQNEAEG